MKTRQRIGAILLAGGLALSTMFLGSAASENLVSRPQQNHVAIYSNGYASVNEQVQPEPGATGYSVEIPEGTDLGTMYVRSITPGVTVMQQQLLPSQYTEAKLLKDYLDKDISVMLKDSGKIVKGKLLQSRGELYLLDGTNPDEKNLIEIKPDQIAAINYQNAENLPQAEPMVAWQFANPTEQSPLFNVNYLTNGVSWKADYFAVLNEKEDQMDLESLVTIANNSGMNLNGSKVVLVAGDINRQQQISPVYREDSKGVAPAPSGTGSFTQANLSEFYKYTLDQIIDLKDGSSQQINFINAPQVAVEKQFVVDFGTLYGYYMQDIQKANAKVQYATTNDEKYNLGMPLPQGGVKFYKDNNGNLEFIGEAYLSNTPKEGKLELAIGNAFDITAERKQTKWEQSSRAIPMPTPLPAPDSPISTDIYPPKSDGNMILQGYQLTLNNAKATEQNVIVFERVPLGAQITLSSRKYEQITPTLLKYIVPVPAGGSATLNYEVTQTVP